MATLVCERAKTAKQQARVHTSADGDRRRRYTYATILMESGKSGRRREGCRMNAKRGMYMVFMGAGEWEQARAV